MSSDLERLILECETGDLETWRELVRTLKRKNMSGKFALLIFHHLRELEKDQQVEARKEAARQAYAVVQTLFSLRHLSWACFHLFRKGDPFSLCGLDKVGSVESKERRHLKPVCKTCLKALGRRGHDIRGIQDFNDRYFR